MELIDHHLRLQIPFSDGGGDSLLFVRVSP
jgi:hypothetical protein